MCGGYIYIYECVIKLIKYNKFGIYILKFIRYETVEKTKFVFVSFLTKPTLLFVYFV